MGLFFGGTSRMQREEVMEALGENSRFQIISATPQANTAYSRVLNTTFPIVDASFLRLKTLSLAYSLPTALLKAVGLNSGRIFLTGQNLFTLTSYEGMDPALPYGGTQFANLRTITGGLHLNF